jgi:hypothetical protein
VEKVKNQLWVGISPQAGRFNKNEQERLLAEVEVFIKERLPDQLQYYMFDGFNPEIKQNVLTFTLKDLPPV